MIKARGRILQTGFACVNAFTVLFTVLAAAVSGAERAVAKLLAIHFPVSDPSSSSAERPTYLANDFRFCI